MQAFIVAVEYRGAGLGAGTCGRRVPVCEHAYDLATATLAGHPATEAPRIGFPSCQRGWNTVPQTARCRNCDTVVQLIVRGLITAAISAITTRVPRDGQAL